MLENKNIFKKTRKIFTVIAVTILLFSAFAIVNTVSAIDISSLDEKENKDLEIFEKYDVDEIRDELRKIFFGDLNDTEMTVEIEEKEEILAQSVEKKEETEGEVFSDSMVTDINGAELNSAEVEATPMAFKSEAKAIPLAVNTQEIEQALVTIKSVERDTNRGLKTKEVMGTVGSVMTVYAEDIEGYVPDKDKVELTVSDEENNVVFVYTKMKKAETTTQTSTETEAQETTTEPVKKGKDAVVTIKYVDGNGKALIGQKEIKSISGNVLTAYAEQINGYTPKKEKEIITVKDSGVTITFTYTKTAEENIPIGATAEIAVEEKSSNPKTGDSSQVAAFAGIFILAAGMFVFSKKRYDSLANN